MNMVYRDETLYVDITNSDDYFVNMEDNTVDRLLS